MTSRLWLAVGMLVVAEVAPAATANCPADLILPCDGSDPSAARQAWLDSFTGSAPAGCGVVTRSLEISTGVPAATIEHSDFSDLSDWQLNGVTATMGNPVLDDAGRRVLRLTSSYYEAGSAFYRDPIALSPDVSFSAAFSFRISGSVGSPDWDGEGADGLVFVVQTASNTAGGDGGGIGYEGIWPSVGVEIDTWNNGWQDFEDGNHVGINTDGWPDSVAIARHGRRFNDGDVWHAWVDYDGSTDTLQARVSDSPARPRDPFLTHVVDLAAILGTPDAFVGFTSGTGAAIGRHDILSFTFHDSYAPVACGGSSAETVVATFTDACGGIARCTRVFEVRDDVPPVIAVGALPDCFATLAEAEAAVVAAASASDACSPPVTLASAASGGCLATITLTATDACGNVATRDQPVAIGAGGTTLAPAAPVTACGGTLEVTTPETEDAAWASPAVVVGSGCGAPLVTNDRTGGGEDATDLYPCGLTTVTFSAEDGCGGTATCEIHVQVFPERRPQDVGAALRVRKDALGDPVLDWSLAPFGPEARFAIIQSDRGVEGLHLAQRLLAAAAFTDRDHAGATLRWYDVRETDCAGRLSED